MNSTDGLLQLKLESLRLDNGEFPVRTMRDRTVEEEESSKKWIFSSASELTSSGDAKTSQPNSARLSNNTRSGSDEENDGHHHSVGTEARGGSSRFDEGKFCEGKDAYHWRDMKAELESYS